MNRNVNEKIVKMVEFAMLLALIIVLQTFGGFVKLGPFSLSLVLIPIVVGSVLLGATSGAALGAIFGIVVVVQCAMGIDAGGFILWGINPFLTAAVCIVKGAAAGFVPGLIYRLINRSGEFNFRHVVGCLVASIAAPIVNTGIFLIGLSTFFNATLIEWAGGMNVMLYIVTGLVGINFLIEVCINIVVSPAISTVVKVVYRELVK